MTIPLNLNDRYQLGAVIGVGGMSEVHLAHDVHLHLDVAIKILRADLARDPSAYLRFRREAQNTAALNHPAIVAVYDTGEADILGGRLPFIVMEYVEGATLKDTVADGGPMVGERSVKILAEVCQALGFQSPARDYSSRRQTRQHHDHYGRCGQSHGLRYRSHAG